VPFTIKLDSSTSVIFSTFTGEVDENDFRSAVAKVASEPGFNPSFSHVIDFTGVTAAKLSTEFLSSFGEQRPPLFTHNARQIVVAPQDFIFGLARMVQMRCEGQLNIEVVRSLNKAYEFLRIERAS